MEQNKSNENNEDEDVSIHFNEICNTLITFKTHITLLQNQMKELEKCVKKGIKNGGKKNKKNFKKRKPSGFATPTLLSDKLCEFMNIEKGSKVARTDVTRFIIKYIKDNSLQNPENRKIIKPNDKLLNLLKIPDNEELNYFNIQRYMNQHFIK